MMKKLITCFDYASYCSIALIPFSMAIAPAPASVFLGVGCFLFLLKKAFSRERAFAPNPITLPLLLFIFISCLSIINSVDLKDSLKGGISRLMYQALLFFVTSEVITSKKRLQGVVVSVVLGLLLASFDCFWQVANGWDFIMRYVPVVNIGIVRATASFKDSNTLGIYLSGFVPLVMGFALYHFKGVKKIAFLGIGLISLAAVVLTYSRPTLLAVYVSLFVFGIAR